VFADFIKGAVGSLQQGADTQFTHQAHDPLGFGILLFDASTTVGGIHGDRLHFKNSVVFQQVSQGMLVVEFIVGIGVEEHPDLPLRLRGTSQDKSQQEKKSR